MRPSPHDVRIAWKDAWGSAHCGHLTVPGYSQSSSARVSAAVAPIGRHSAETISLLAYANAVSQGNTSDNQDLVSAATHRKTISNTPSWKPRKSAPKVTSGIFITSNPVTTFDCREITARRIPLVRPQFSGPFSAFDALAASVRIPKGIIPLSRMLKNASSPRLLKMVQMQGGVTHQMGTRYPSTGWVQVRGVLSLYVAAPRE